MRKRGDSVVVVVVVFSPQRPQILISAPSLEAELAPKREVPPGEATALEALLRGDGVLEKKTNICKEEETLLEIQVALQRGTESFDRPSS